MIGNRLVVALTGGAWGIRTPALDGLRLLAQLIVERTA